MTDTRRPLIAGNWKMNLDHIQATVLVQKLDWTLQDKRHDYDEVEVAIIPPFTDLRSVQTLIDGDKMKLILGAQDLSAHDDGAFTGEVSGAFVAKLGVTYVIVGHSERRSYHAEGDEVCAAKVRAAFRNGLTPILCVGEPLDIRQEGLHVEHVLHQLASSLDELSAQRAEQIVIAYEPVWAIGTGEVASPEDAQEVCAAIRAKLAQMYDDELAAKVRILYGGSVKSGNIASVMAKEDVDGALVGGASLEADEFAAICRYKSHVGVA